MRSPLTPSCVITTAAAAAPPGTLEARTPTSTTAGRCTAITFSAFGRSEIPDAEGGALDPIRSSEGPFVRRRSDAVAETPPGPE